MTDCSGPLVPQTLQEGGGEGGGGRGGGGGGRKMSNFRSSEVNRKQILYRDILTF